MPISRTRPVLRLALARCPAGSLRPGVWDDESAADDPGEPPATDAATLKRLLRQGRPCRGRGRSGTACRQVTRTAARRYRYFDTDDEFRRAAGGPLTITLGFLDRGAGRIVLEYDSTDAGAPLEGAYKPFAASATRGNTGAWREAAWAIEGARLAGRQNGGADFRLQANDAPPLLLRKVRLEDTRSPADNGSSPRDR